MKKRYIFFILFFLGLNIDRVEAQDVQVNLVVPYLTTNLKYKLFDATELKFVSDNLYDEIDVIDPELFLVTNSGKKGLVNNLGENIAIATYDCIKTVGSTHLLFQLGSKFGLMNRKGETVIQPIYDALHSQGDSILITSIKNGKIVKHGIIDLNGKVVVENKFRQLNVIGLNQLVVSLDNKLNYLANSRGTMMSAAFTYIFDDHIVNLKEKYGLISPQGKLIIPTIYNTLRKLENGYYLAENAEGKAGLLDSLGKVVIPFDKYTISSMGEGIYSLNRTLYLSTNKPGISLFNTNTGRAIPGGPYEEVGIFKEGLSYVKLSGKIGYINADGKIVIAPIYDSTFESQIPTDIDFGSSIIDDIFGFPLEGDDGGDEEDSGEDFLDNSCYYENFENPSNLGPLMPNSIQDFSSGLAVVVIGKKMGAIDPNGKIIVPITYDYLTPFRNGLAIGLMKISDEKFKPYIISNNGEVALEDYVIDTWLDSTRIILKNREGDFYDVSLLDNTKTRALGKDITQFEHFENYIRYRYKGVYIYANDEFNRYSDEVIDFSKYDAEQLVQGGNSKRYAEAYDEAISEYNKALNLDANNFNAFMGLGEVYKARRNYSDAIESAEKAYAVASGENKTLALTLKFEVYKAQGNWNESIETATQIIYLNSDNPYQWYVERGYVRLQHGQYGLAVDDFNSALTGSFTSYKGTVYNLRGVGYSRLKMYPNALNDFKKATVQGVQDGEAESSLGIYFNNLGNTYLTLKKKPEAAIALKKAAGFGNQDAARTLRSNALK